MENEYISVKEFAEKAGISVQAVYKRLNNRLKQYVKVVDNQKMLDIRALQDIYGIKVKQPIQPKLTTSSTQNSTSDTLVDTLLMQIEILKNELDVKNEQIREKDNQLNEKDNQMAALNARLEESLRLLDQQQQLQAMEKKIQVLENKQEDVVEPVEEHPETKHWWETWRELRSRRLERERSGIDDSK